MFRGNNVVTMSSPLTHTERTLSPRQVAEAIGVSVSSLKRWCDNGQLATTKTAGGHRRILRSEVVRFMREQGMSPNCPELLGLPAGSRLEPREVTEVLPRLVSALGNGDQEQVSAILTGLFLARKTIAEICDSFLAPAFHQIGQRWQNSKLEIYQEHRAVCIAQAALHHLRSAITPPVNKGLAISATLNDDPYILPITLSDLVLHDQGWDSRLFGTMHPAETLIRALRTLKPRLVCLSLSFSADPEALMSACESVCQEAEPLGITIAVGGVGFVPTHVSHPGGTYCKSMGELRTLAIGLGVPQSNERA